MKPGSVGSSFAPLMRLPCRCIHTMQQMQCVPSITCCRLSHCNGYCHRCNAGMDIDKTLTETFSAYAAQTVKFARYRLLLFTRKFCCPLRHIPAEPAPTDQRLYELRQTASKPVIYFDERQCWRSQ